MRYGFRGGSGKKYKKCCGVPDAVERVNPAWAVSEDIRKTLAEQQSARGMFFRLAVKGAGRRGRKTPSGGLQVTTLASC